jgi:UDP-3-O-acyl-N-acetylglucosamine deacetylase
MLDEHNPFAFEPVGVHVGDDVHLSLQPALAGESN